MRELGQEYRSNYDFTAKQLITTNIVHSGLVPSDSDRKGSTSRHGTFLETGLENWNHGVSCLLKHQNSSFHQTSSLKVQNLLSVLSPVSVTYYLTSEYRYYLHRDIYRSDRFDNHSIRMFFRGGR